MTTANILRRPSRRQVLFAATVLGVIGVVAVVSTLELENRRTHQELFSLADNLSGWYNTLTKGHSDNRRLASMLAVAEDQEAVYDELRATFESMERSLGKFETQYARRKRRAPRLRTTNSEFEAVFAVARPLVNASMVIPTIRRLPRSSAEDFLYALDSLDRSAVDTYRPAMDDALAKAWSALGRVSKQSSTITLIMSFVSFVATIAALCCVLLLLNHVFHEASRRVATQDQLVRQQAHEMRNKYAPAMSVMEQVKNLANSPDTTVDDFRALKHDSVMALVALKEVEAQQQARLDIYKILRGNYRLHLETFDVVGFLRERANVERAVALARNQGSDPHNVEFVVRLANEYDGCEEIHVRGDHYVLKHVVSNCLSNSRKFTYTGSVVVTFCGVSERDDSLLVFTVADTGVGLPRDVADSIFRTEVATGDVRGTGLGLPSCALFCQTAGGYIKLKETRQQDESGRNGYTVFEFAVAGTIVRADRSKPEKEDLVVLEEHKSPSTTMRRAIPDDVAVIVVDDSALNRRCTTRCLQQCQKTLSAVGWTYSQFETFEAAQPFLLETHESSKRAIVCLDENMGSRGGVMTGIMGTRWLVHDVGFSGIIISTSGDVDVGDLHVQLGALNWGKPLPSRERMIEDLKSAFDVATSKC